MNKIQSTKIFKSTASKAKIEAVLPLKITVDGKDEFILSRIGDVIDVSDLHPRVRIMLKAQEERARKGMPLKTVTANEIIEEL